MSDGGNGAERDEAEGGLGDVHRVVADALQVVRHLDGRDDEAEVAGDRLLEREQRNGEPLDLVLQGIDLAVAGDDGLGLVLVLRQQGVDGEVDEAFGALRHLQQLLLQRSELVVKVAKPGGLGAHPNLPVM